MKLSQEEIKFIDTYLESSEVIYSDIRQEMVDHIATAVEEKMQLEQQDFYVAFKSYMLANKKDILKNNKKRWSFSWEAIRQFLLFLARPHMLLFGVFVFFFFKNVNVNRYFSADFTLKNLFFVLVLTAVLFQSGYIHLYLKKRFYKVEKTAVILAFIYYGQFCFFPFFGTEEVSHWTLSIFSFLFFGYVFFFIQELIKFHKHRFNFI
ncbi:hypothetical protein [Flavobacterium sp. TBRC 19031]|uniref:hypothetical protein n=1 Tax=Flavobacterium mekongense TaxID=3379707 RepID=UPI00399C2B5D